MEMISGLLSPPSSHHNRRVLQVRFVFCKQGDQFGRFFLIGLLSEALKLAPKWQHYLAFCLLSQIFTALPKQVVSKHGLL
jgi:hypothetical protein